MIDLKTQKSDMKEKYSEFITKLKKYKNHFKIKKNNKK